MGYKLSAASIKCLVVLLSELLRLLLPLIFVVDFMVCGPGRWETFNMGGKEILKRNPMGFATPVVSEFRAQ